MQNPRRILHIALYCANARARKLATPTSRVAVKWCWLQHWLAASVGIVLGKAECCRQSWGFAERKLTAGKSEYLFAAKLLNAVVSGKSPQIFVARWVRDSVFRTNRRSIGEMWLNRQTDSSDHAKYCNPRCACAPKLNDYHCNHNVIIGAKFAKLTTL